MTLLRSSTGQAGISRVPPIVPEVLRSPGNSLDAESRKFFEPRFGHDFSRVRVHTDVLAAESARSVGAAAYTVGPHIVFDSVFFSPHTTAGKRLLAHELVHVVQQSAFTGSTPQVPEGLTTERPTGPLEVEAHRSENAIMKGSADGGPKVAVGSTRGAPVIQRQEAPPPTKEEVRLRGLARRPSAALKAWRTLGPAGRSFVLMTMTGLYGPDFALKFTEYADGKKKPDFSTEVIQADPKSLLARGFRYAGDPGGVPLWVKPSGHEAMILSRGSPAPPTTEQHERTPEEVERCGHMCDDIDDEDACNACCDERIPESDSPCRTNCKTICAEKL